MREREGERERERGRERDWVGKTTNMRRDSTLVRNVGDSLGRERVH